MNEPISQDRLIPQKSDTTIQDEARLTPPFIEIQVQVTESDQLIRAYSKQHPCRKLFSALFVIGSCGFDLYFPFAIALLLQKIRDYLNNQIND